MTNKAAQHQSKVCYQNIQLLENPQLTRIQPWPVPNYYDEYIRKYGIGDRKKMSYIKESFDILSFGSLRTLEDMIEHVEDLSKSA